MKVLVACEFSGIVREAFKARGHDAWSCDLLPTEIEGNHIQGDVLEILNDGWDMMIFFWPCTNMAVSGARWFRLKIEEQKKDIECFRKLMECNIPKICGENPIGILSTKYRKPDQIIQPWQFGHGETKATCLWLKNLFIKAYKYCCRQRPKNMEITAIKRQMEKQKSHFPWHSKSNGGTMGINQNGR